MVSACRVSNNFSLCFTLTGQWMSLGIALLTIYYAVYYINVAVKWKTGNIVLSTIRPTPGLRDLAWQEFGMAELWHAMWLALVSQLSGWMACLSKILSSL